MKKIIHFYDYNTGRYTAEQFVNSCIYRYIQYRESLKAVRKGYKAKGILYKYTRYFQETADSCELGELGYEIMEHKFHKLSEKSEKYQWTKPITDEAKFDKATVFFVKWFKTTLPMEV